MTHDLRLLKIDRLYFILLFSCHRDIDASVQYTKNEHLILTHSDMVRTHIILERKRQDEKDSQIHKRQTGNWQWGRLTVSNTTKLSFANRVKAASVLVILRFQPLPEQGTPFVKKNLLLPGICNKAFSTITLSTRIAKETTKRQYAHSRRWISLYRCKRI